MSSSATTTATAAAAAAAATSTAVLSTAGSAVGGGSNRAAASTTAANSSALTRAVFRQNHNRPDGPSSSRRDVRMPLLRALLSTTTAAPEPDKDPAAAPAGASAMTTTTKRAPSTSVSSPSRSSTPARSGLPAIQESIRQLHAAQVLERFLEKHVGSNHHQKRKNWSRSVGKKRHRSHHDEDDDEEDERSKRRKKRSAQETDPNQEIRTIEDLRRPLPPPRRRLDDPTSFRNFHGGNASVLNFWLSSSNSNERALVASRLLSELSSSSSEGNGGGESGRTPCSGSSGGDRLEHARCVLKSHLIRRALLIGNNSLNQGGSSSLSSPRARLEAALVLVQAVPSPLWSRSDFGLLVNGLRATTTTTTLPQRGGRRTTATTTDPTSDAAILHVLASLLLHVAVPSPPSTICSTTGSSKISVSVNTTTATTASTSASATTSSSQSESSSTSLPLELALHRQNRWLWSLDPIASSSSLSSLCAGTPPPSLCLEDSGDAGAEDGGRGTIDSSSSLSPLAILLMALCRYRQLSTASGFGSGSTGALERFSPTAAEWCRHVLSLLLDPERTPRGYHNGIGGSGAIVPPLPASVRSRTLPQEGSSGGALAAAALSGGMDSATARTTILAFHRGRAAAAAAAVEARTASSGGGASDTAATTAIGGRNAAGSTTAAAGSSSLLSDSLRWRMQEESSDEDGIAGGGNPGPPSANDGTPGQSENANNQAGAGNEDNEGDHDEEGAEMNDEDEDEDDEDDELMDDEDEDNYDEAEIMSVHPSDSEDEIMSLQEANDDGNEGDQDHDPEDGVDPRIPPPMEESVARSDDVGLTDSGTSGGAARHGNNEMGPPPEQPGTQHGGNDPGPGEEEENERHEDGDEDEDDDEQHGEDMHDEEDDYEEEDDDDDDDEVDPGHDADEMDDGVMDIGLEDIAAAVAFSHRSTLTATAGSASTHRDATGAVRSLRGLSTSYVASGSRSTSTNVPASISSFRVAPLTPEQIEHRKHLLLKASMQVLCELYPHMHHQHATPSRRDWLLDVEGETLLVEGMNAILVPPKKPNTTKIVMRRAPSQEEYFRGSLSRNPITIASLTRNLQHSGTAGSQSEPTVADLRLHIATELGMADSVELLEILVAGKILDVSLKLRVVHQVLWRNHLIENPTASSSSAVSSMPALLSAGGLSMIFSSSLSERLASARGGAGRGSITADTPVELLPPMVTTYRLAGVDGEATEDTVTNLVDPEESKEHSWEWTMDVVAGRGIFVLLRSVQHTVADTLAKIRRDDIQDPTGMGPAKNLARERFRISPPPAPLILLQHCCQLSCNRRLLLQARAPTVLLALLLDTLKVLGGSSLGPCDDQAKSNPTAEALQQLIETLTGDISDSQTSSHADSSSLSPDATSEDAYESDAAEDAASMPLLLQAIEASVLSPPLRLLIARLMPFLTYGQADLSKTLASHFSRNIRVDWLGDCEQNPDRHVLMNTFVQTAVSLPSNSVCNVLRMELVQLVTDLLSFIATDMPKQPPPTSPALWGKNKKPPKKLQLQWDAYMQRSGLKTAFQMLIGVCKEFAPLQARLNKAEWLRGVHWIETTSDSVGLLAEEFLDSLKAADSVAKTVEGIRAKTRQRKKELADERRVKALQKMVNFSGQPAVERDTPDEPRLEPAAAPPTAVAAPPVASSSVRSAAASILAPVLGLFSSSEPAPVGNVSAPATAASSGTTTTSKEEESAPGSESSRKETEAKKPAWLKEMEAMEDEEGIVCSVCQEGRTLQPEELLGLYAYIKKVTVLDLVTRAGIEGISLLKALPSSLPESLMGDPVAEGWYLVGKTTADSLPLDSSSSASSSSAARRNATFVTTVSAGNAIHFSCHRRARLADRNNAKAPKSEWEGALLRNSRVSCNVILPLVSCHSSRVPLMAVDSALTEHQATVSNLLGSTPKSMLWTCLHDVRLLLLRMAYGEPLNADCGGGSLASNCLLLFYQLQAADMFDKDAQVDQPDQSSRARGLAPGFLAACAATTPDATVHSTTLVRSIADAAPMATLTGVVFGNAGDVAPAAGGTTDSAKATMTMSGKPSQMQGGEPSSSMSKSLWMLGRHHFFRGLVICAGRRHALGLGGSGCQRIASVANASSANTSNARSRLLASAGDWQWLEVSDGGPSAPSDLALTTRSTTRSGDGTRASGGVLARHATSVTVQPLRNRPEQQQQQLLEDFGPSLRPLLTYYVMMDALALSYSPAMDDVPIEEAANQLAGRIEACRNARTIRELLSLCSSGASPAFEASEVVELLQMGMVVA